MQQMTNMADVEVGATVYKEGVFWTVTRVTIGADQIVITADMNDTSDLCGKHIPEPYRKGMTFGGRPGAMISVTLK